MPCVVETQAEDNAWRKAKDEHHQRVEKLLESLLAGKSTTAETEALLRLEKSRFANEYKRCYGGLCNEGHIKKAMQNIINGKGPHDR